MKLGTMFSTAEFYRFGVVMHSITATCWYSVTLALKIYGDPVWLDAAQIGLLWMGLITVSLIAWILLPSKYQTS